MLARLRTLRRLRLTKLGYFDERPRLLPRLGLRTRITLAFGVGAMLLSAMVGVTTWALTQQNLLDEREADTTLQASANAEQIDQRLTPELEDPTGALSSLVTQGGSTPLLRKDEDWFLVTPQYGEAVAEVLSARTGPLLWIGGMVGLWTAGSFVRSRCSARLASPSRRSRMRRTSPSGRWTRSRPGGRSPVSGPATGNSWR